MFRSLQSRLFLTHLLASGLVLSLVGVSLVIILLRSPVAEQRAVAQLEAGLPLVLERGEGRLLLRLTDRELQSAVSRIDQAVGARVLVVDPEGEVLADSRSGQPGWPQAELQSLADAGVAGRGTLRATDHRQWIYITRPLASGYALMLAVPHPRLLTLRALGDDLLLRPLLQASGVALVLAILLSYLIARWVARPLDRIAEASRGIAEGRYTRIEPSGPQEVRNLGGAFNSMAARLQSSLQSQRDFVANVSHELKTPLTSIQGFAQAILEGAVEDEAGREHAARVIYDEADRLRRLVADLLDLARMDAGQVEFKRERIDLGRLLRAVSERLAIRSQGESDVEIEMKSLDLPPIIGDGDRLAQVFTNLLDNAFKHSPAGGKVRVLGEQAAGWVSIHVDDQGPGIPPDELSRIFERFYQLDKARPGGAERGAGLGLAISREIVSSHGGRLTAQSEPGRGSRFTVKLPVVRPDDSTLASTQD
jgi:two-component system OmpR family sensor kinase